MNGVLPINKCIILSFEIQIVLKKRNAESYVNTIVYIYIRSFYFFFFIYNEKRLSNLTNRSNLTMIEKSTIHSPNDISHIDDEYFYPMIPHLLEEETWCCLHLNREKVKEEKEKNRTQRKNEWDK